MDAKGRSWESQKPSLLIPCCLPGMEATGASIEETWLQINKHTSFGQLLTDGPMLCSGHNTQRWGDTSSPKFPTLSQQAVWNVGNILKSTLWTDTDSIMEQYLWNWYHWGDGCSFSSSSIFNIWSGKHIIKGIFQIWLLFCLTACVIRACWMPGEIIPTSLGALLCHSFKQPFAQSLITTHIQGCRLSS